MVLERVVAILLGSKLRVAGALVGLLVVGGAAGAATGVLGAPSVVGVENRFGDVNGTTTAIESDLRIHNPNPVGVRLGGTSVDYAVEMNGLTMASGTKEGVGVETGNSTLSFTSSLRNERIPAWWTSHLRNGERTNLTVGADVRSSLVGASVGAPNVEREIETDVASAFDSTETQPINASQSLVGDPVLYLNETSGDWGAVNETATPIEMSFTVYNPKPYPISASAIGYDVSMNDVAMGSGSTESAVTIPPGETRTIEATTALRNQRLDEWWVTHLERNQVTDLTVEFYARFDLSATGGGTVRVPLDDVTHEIETDMFGTKNGSAAGNGTDADGDGTPTPTPGSEGTTTDDGSVSFGGDDPESSAGETPTETATATSTDDGGILG